VIAHQVVSGGSNYIIVVFGGLAVVVCVVLGWFTILLTGD
jgi:hypothetical protein